MIMKKLTAYGVIASVMAVLVLLAGCSNVRRYSRNELVAKTVFVFPPVYDTIIAPLNSEIIPIAKRIFFIKNDIAELKESLNAGGSNHRLSFIDNKIDTLRCEIHRLQAIRRELLSAIYEIYPPYKVPEVIPYAGRNNKYKPITRPIILVTTHDLRDYETMKYCEVKMSEEINCKPLIAAAKRQYKSLPASFRKPIEPLGTPGGVPRIKPYNLSSLPGRIKDKN